MGVQRRRGWSGRANRSGGNVPCAPQDAAVFGPLLSGGTATVTLDYGASLASLGFSTTGGASYVISPSSGSTLILSNTAGAATLSNSGGNQTIAAPIMLGSSLSVSISAGSVLNLVAAISPSGSGDALTLDGGGELILSGSNNYGGGTTVLSGTLELTSPAAMPNSGVLTIAGRGRWCCKAVCKSMPSWAAPYRLCPSPRPSCCSALARLGWRQSDGGEGRAGPTEALAKPSVARD